MKVNFLAYVLAFDRTREEVVLALISNLRNFIGAS